MLVGLYHLSIDQSCVPAASSRHKTIATVCWYFTFYVASLVESNSPELFITCVVICCCSSVCVVSSVTYVCVASLHFAPCFSISRHA